MFLLQYAVNFYVKCLDDSLRKVKIKYIKYNSALYFINGVRADVGVKYLLLRTKKNYAHAKDNSVRTMCRIQVTLTIYVTIYVTQEHLVIFILRATNSLDSQNVFLPDRATFLFFIYSSRVLVKDRIS